MTEYKFTNKLTEETSPYLLSHSHNPVNWYPWSKEALKKAKDENKLLIVSIGYAACHWCHVMEKESFENEEVADLMNENFVCIKVDREERPDLDQEYMSAAMLITGRGGWPLNAFALPEGLPFFAGTYYPKTSWIEILMRIAQIWRDEPEKIVAQAKSLAEGIIKTDEVIAVKQETDFDDELVNSIAQNILSQTDFENGGQKGSPKFPMPVGIDFLLRYSKLYKSERAEEAFKTTLENMFRGGIYDHIGGGFARYSVDQFWHVPHFEKMLYDNAQLISVYSDAYKTTKDEYYRKVVFDTIDFVNRELFSDENLFYSSLDADSEGEEGKYYCWTKDEIENILGSDANYFCDIYNITETGNWEEQKNIPNLLRYNKSLNKLDFKKNNHLNKKLLTEREKRIKPALDDKILTSWNALMIKSLVDAGNAFDEPRFVELSEKCINSLLVNLCDDNFNLKRTYKNGTAKIDGFLDDYAHVIEALIVLYESTFKQEYLIKAEKFFEQVDQNFLNPENGMYFYTDNNSSVVVSKKTEFMDNVIPSSNSVMAWNLFKLGKLFSRADYNAKAKQMLVNVKKNLKEGSYYFSNWSSLLIAFVKPFSEVVILGEEFDQIKRELNKEYIPAGVFTGGKKESELDLHNNRLIKGETNIYVCTDLSCKLPVKTSNEVLELLN